MSLELPQGLLESDFQLACLDYSFTHFSIIISQNLKIEGCKLSHLQHGCMMLWVNSEIAFDTCLCLSNIYHGILINFQFYVYETPFHLFEHERP